MKIVGFILTITAGLLFLTLIQGCASTAEQEDIYGNIIGETTAEIDTTQMLTLSEENKTLKEQISKLETQNSQLQREKSELEKKIQSLQENNAQLTAKLSDLGAQLEAEKQKTRELSLKLSEYESQPKPGATELELRAEIVKRDSEITEYKRQIRDLQAKLAELETKLTTQPAETKPATVAGEAKLAYPGITAETPKIAMTEKQFRNYYNLGLNAFKNRKYKMAISYFDTLMRSSVETNLKINAVYWAGESYFALKQYEKAIEYFNYVAQTKSTKTPDALYMLGRCYAALGKIKEAKEYMNRVLKEYPRSPVAKKAKERLERL
ncbi:tetratricopeptide repeat protein [Candidatus Kryptobacter tengchongensis]|uniref:Tol-pal system protein YbgF n=1 Tax=Kryptobacter tengchongensis TaxID=1643429 RepID=A0A656D960_KRYT1|nr:tetratricopeptide repeat protein [Candidatus Kryptobacter tengchongensis]CUT01783.1 tol-pal system protein YbgF [Candidatus Kryptobacter tengchongensis]